MILVDHPAAKRCFGGWAGFISKAVTDKECIASHSVSINPVKGLSEIQRRFEDLTELSDEQVSELIKKMIAFKVQMEMNLQENATSLKSRSKSSGPTERTQVDQTVQAKARL